MELTVDIDRLIGDAHRQALKPGARLKAAASCFPVYGFEALKAGLEQVDALADLGPEGTCDPPPRLTTRLADTQPVMLQCRSGVLFFPSIDVFPRRSSRHD